jgi:4,5-dihydroxyphthalate decarboxylase
MADLKLSFACWNYDRVQALMDGSVHAAGIELTSLPLFPAETFQRMVKFKEFDLSEMGFKFYASTLALDDPPFIAIPVFPVRLFVHSAIFINRNSGIAKPADLIGKKVGELFAYGHDAAIWARGILNDEYGVPIDSATYYVGGLDQTTKRDFAPFPPPPNIRVRPLEPHQTLDAMLQTGEIDALYSAIVPPSVIKRSKDVGRLFENYEAVERDYFRTTGIFPVIHLIAIRREVYRKHPWIAQSLYGAFKEAKSRLEKLHKSQEANMHRLFMTPWLTAHQEENRMLMGDDFWPYGLEPNRKALDTFLRYHHEQGLAKRRINVDELFAPETLVDYARFTG